MGIVHQGLVKWYKRDKGYGRITLDDAEGHAFVHFSGIKPDPARFPNDFRFLEEGQRVSFRLIENPDLKDQAKTAVDVEVLVD